MHKQGLHGNVGKLLVNEAAIDHWPCYSRHALGLTLAARAI